MRILYLQTFPFWGSGSGTYARHLASEVGKRHKVAILAPDTRPIERAKLYTVNLPFPIAFTGHPEWPDCKLYTDISNKQIWDVYDAFLRATITALEDFHPDIIHVHHAFPTAWLAAFVKDTYNINYVVTIHGSELPTLERDRRYYQRTYDSMYRAKQIFPNSGYTRDKFVYSESGAKAVDKELNLHGKPVVVFAGKLTKYKGVEFLVGASKNIHGEVVILGDGPEKLRLQEKAKQLNLTNIHWVGHLGAGVKKLVPYYSRADVFVAPSVWDEPLGLVILEAMACQTPVVVTRKGGIPLAVKEGYNGLFVRARNSKEIVEKVNKLLDNASMRYKMGQNARKSVEEKFSWELIGNKFERSYEKFAKKSNGAAHPSQVPMRKK